MFAKATSRLIAFGYFKVLFRVFFENFAFVNIFFKFGGWRLLFKKYFLENIAFILSSLSKSDLLFSGKTSGLCGLNVVTYGIKLLSCLVSLVFSKSFLFNAFTFLMLSSMSAGGYFCFNR